MKRLVLIVAAATATLFTSCNESASAKIDEANLTAAAQRDAVKQDYPEMTFDETSYDFGTVTEGTVVEHEYTFTNTGSSPLVIVNAKGSCGCTVPTWTKEPVAPGEKGMMLVKFNTSGKPDAQTKTVTIKTNTKSGQESITINGFVTPRGQAATPNA
ncbi:DUF1573 domain-containing protein [Nonlabens ponticola]|uniref:DUF1573 domain-containing protein n=1 Tax=Nonlabens ponticola TaxID=2496866 RepID=A0A3S9MX70_9FLAO|nr:DUF1573 domain-containing protein [Nonlabens ponticola]AZQ43738.1 DUF1573 domain-containing protein [Nonlabens ponticola]